jgi:hypothetical protein
VTLIEDGRAQLDAVIEDLSSRDPHWALAGNSGGISPGRLAIRITDPHGTDQRTEAFPARVHSLDENFILVRHRANLALSRDLSGFHLYGADLCIVADILGWTAYVVDFHLRHDGAGKRDQSLAESRAALVEKYGRALRSRWVTTPCEVVYLSGTAWIARLLSARVPTRILQLLGARLRRRGLRRS